MDAMGIRMVKHLAEQELYHICIDIELLEDRLSHLNIRKLKLESELKAIEQLEEL